MSDAMLYFPRFHREFLTALPDAPLAFIASALDAQARIAPDCADDAVGKVAFLFASALPFGPRESKALLDDMHSVSRELKDSLAPFSLRHGEERSSWKEREAESAAAETFRKTGGVFPAEKGVSGSLADAEHEDYVESCQKLLLLIDAMERNILERRAIFARYAEAEQKLRRALSEESSEGPEELGKADVLRLASPVLKHDGETNEKIGEAGGLPPWRTVLGALLPFLPDGVPLYTEEPDILNALDPFAQNSGQGRISVIAKELLAGVNPAPEGIYAEKRVSFVFPPSAMTG